MHGHVTCAVDVSPNVVDAGAEMTLRGKVTCSPSCDLRGHTLLVKDEAGADAGSIELTEFAYQQHQRYFPLGWRLGIVLRCMG